MIAKVQSRILFIADSHIAGDLFRAAIEGEQRHVGVAVTGGEGMALHEASPFDAIVICDQLTDMSGVQAARAFLGRNAAIPITFLVTPGNEGQIPEALAVGITNFAIQDTQNDYVRLLPHLVTQSLAKSSGVPGNAISELEPHQQRLTEAAKLAKLGFWIWDEIQDCAVYCSDELAKIHGITTEEFLQRATSLDGGADLVHPEDRDRYHKFVEVKAAEGSGYEIEFRIIAADGSVKHVIERAEYSVDGTGAPTQSFGIIQDITQLAEARQALGESEARHTRAAQMAKLGHWAWDEVNERGIYGSEEYANLFGQTAAEYYEFVDSYDKLLTFIHPGDRARYDDVMRAAEEAKSGYEITMRVQLPGGVIKHVKEIAEAVLDNEGRHSQTVGTTLDITEQVESEISLAERDMRRSHIVGQFGSEVKVHSVV